MSSSRHGMNSHCVGLVFLAAAGMAALPPMAGTGAAVDIPLPPPIIFPSPPEVIVIPETYVYVVPDADVDIYFSDGWWWRPWKGRWYRSRRYDGGWASSRGVPPFYAGIPPGWRNDFRDRQWKGSPWNCRRIPHDDLRKNWKTWKITRHWEKEETWGVTGLARRGKSGAPPASQKHTGAPDKGRGGGKHKRK